MNGLFYGAWPALVTPFTSEDTVNVKVVRDLVEYHLDKKVAGFYVCGRTGQGLAMSVAERQLVAETVIEHVRNRVPVIIHIGALAIQDALILARHARQSGADGISSIIPPYYDDRGKVYVKYGPPDARHIGKLSMEGIKENESWAYEESIRKGLTFDFVKKGHSYREVNDLAEAAPPGVNISSIEGVRSQLYGERFGFTESYDRFSLVGPEGINQTMLAEFQANRIVANRDAPAESFVHELPGKRLSFVYNIAQFRTPDKKNRTEI